MLQSLRVRDFLLVEDATLELGAGLVVLTGETGTGKSILLSALALLLGARGSAQLVRQGAEELQIEAVFAADAQVRRTLREIGIPRDGETLVITRQIDGRGRSRCFVNRQRALVATLRRLGAQLVELHGQREEERFRRPDVQRDLLDLFGGHQALRRQMREAHASARDARSALQTHRERLARLATEEDWLRFQVAEIAEIDPQPGELESLREEARAARAAADRTRRIELSERVLNGPEGGILAALEELDHEVGCGEDADPAWQDFRAAVGALRQEGRGVYRRLGELRRVAETQDASLERLEPRLRQLEHLQRKHRRDLNEIVALGEQMRASLEELESGQRREAELATEFREREAAMARAADALRASRETAAPRMARALERELRTLGMPDSRLRIALPLRRSAGEAAIGARGGEGVVFEIETNPGEGFRALGEVASGGEMSRVALSIRVVLGGAGRSRVTVFDEIDAGLGGAAAKAVASRLARVARHRQVLLVTHLPIIAAAAQRQFRVAKVRRGARNVATVEPLAEDGRVAEIARMLAGDGSDARAREHARGLLGGRR